MKNLLGIGISIGVLAGLWTFASAELGLITWVAFAAWALFFAAGANATAYRTTLAATLSGVFWAYLVSLVLQVAGGNVVLAVAVGVIALAMCLQAAVPLLGFIPGAFVGAAVLFGTTFDVVGTVLALVLGASLGWLSAVLGAKIQSAVDSRSHGATPGVAPATP